MSSSTSSGSTPGTPSISSAVKPLPLHKPPGLVAESRLLEVAALSLAPAALSALRTVLEAEAAYHLQVAAFSNDASDRDQHRGVYRWLQEFLNGTLLDRYAAQAREKLALETPVGAPEGGSDWMESDRLGPEEA